MNGRHLVQVVGDIDGHLFAFLEPQNRPGRRAVVTDTFLDEITGVDLDPVNGNVVLAGVRHHGGKPGQHRYQ